MKLCRADGGFTSAVSLISMNFPSFLNEEEEGVDVKNGAEEEEEEEKEEEVEVEVEDCLAAVFETVSAAFRRAV